MIPIQPAPLCTAPQILPDDMQDLSITDMYRQPVQQKRVVNRRIIRPHIGAGEPGTRSAPCGLCVMECDMYQILGDRLRVRCPNRRDNHKKTSMTEMHPRE